MSNIIIPTSPADRDRIRNAMKEISASFTRTEAEKNFVKDAINALAEDVPIPKKILRKMAVIYHKQNITEVTTEAEDLEALYELINGGV
jgi:ribosome maturation protein Sdo1